MDDPRGECLKNIMNVLLQYDVPVQDVRARLYLILDKFDISPRTTEMVVYEGDNISKMCNEFLRSKTVAGCTNRTIRHYRNTLKGFFQEVPVNPIEVTPDNIRMYLAIKEVRDKNSRTSILNNMRVLSSFFQWMQDNDKIVRNPMKKVEKIRHKPHKEKAFTDIEVEKIRMGCRDEREKCLIEMLLSTGCRISEIASIKVSDIDHINNSIEVLGKGMKYRTVYLNAKAQMAIEMYLAKRNDQSPYMFAKGKKLGSEFCLSEFMKGKQRNLWWMYPETINPSGTIDVSSLGGTVRDIGKRVGVQGVHPHRFRKTCATDALKRGMPIELVSKMLGHEDISTTQIYLDITEEDLALAHKKYVL